MRAASALGSEDYFGVVAFDHAARWALEVHQLVDFVTLDGAVGGIQAEGQTNLRSGVEAAYAALQTTSARRKHLILLTDGWVRQGNLTPLARQMREQGITLSVVAAGGGSAEYLAGVAQSGGGRYYPAADILQVPDFFLKETIKAVGQYIIEEPFYPVPSGPSSVLRGLDPAALPPLLGYNGATSKSTALVALSTPRGDPLLATWQHGLGRAAAWTSDLKGRWAVDWVAWDGFPRFATQLVGWTLPAPEIEGLSAQAHMVEDRAIISVEATNPPSIGSRYGPRAGLPRNFLDVQATLVGPDLQKQDVTLEQVGAGRYAAQVVLSQPGTYLVRLGISEGGTALGQQTLGLVVPYSPEYRVSGTDLAKLTALAHLTGGGELSEPEAAFVHNLPTIDQAREVWAPLLLMAALLFPLDVALRRVMLGPRDLRKGAIWLRARLLPSHRGISRPDRMLGRLFQARDRVRGQPPGMHAKPHPSDAPQSQPQELAPTDSDVEPVQTSTDNTLERLREAKKRARRNR
jgi:hypothetical protein